ncbi:MAG: Glucosamine-6-phosphate deaminase [isomerizing], alternative [Rhodanobacteraceae bacterium]|jgi:glucosamine--fructose-6-phosphate aminotransferase (isomerizing)|nr:MAG: Glucosamine-6-phosphate deaminase [isomerizing], alternative [Rhodanobacteraceae bacterium]
MSAEMKAEATLLHREAAEAADTVARQLERNDAAVCKLAASLRDHAPPFVATCARGSSDHAATYAKYVIETQTGCVTASASPSVESIYSVPLRLRDALYLVISQSGASPDLLRSAEAARNAGARVVALVNAEHSPLAALADTVIPLQAGPEKSVAATKSFIGSLGAVLHLVAHWRQDVALLDALHGLPEQLRQAFELDWSALVEGLRDMHDLFVLGRGYGLAAAQEAALKLKETCALHAEAFSSAEVRHGPMELVGPRLPVLLFAQQDDALPGVMATARDFHQRGAEVWTAAPGAVGRDALPIVPTSQPMLAPILAIQSFYRAVNALAIARGRDPDRPPHLAKVTETV